MLKTAGQIGNEILQKLSRDDTPIIGPTTLGMGLTGAGAGGLIGALTGHPVIGTLAGGGVGAGLGALLGSASAFSPRAKMESGWHEGAPGAGEMYGANLGAGLGALGLAPLGPSMIRALEQNRYGKYFGLGAIPIGASIAGGIGGSYLGSKLDE